jgi:hypothetical protein
MEAERDPAAGEQIWAGAGWGPPLTWPARSPGGERLIFSLRLPLGWSTTALPGPVAEEDESGPLASLNAWSQLSGAITAQRLELVLRRPGAPDFPLLATLVATLGAVEGSPDRASGPEGVPAVTLSGLEGVRVRTVRELAAPDTTAASLLVVQYLLQTFYGGLAVAFTAPQAQFHDKLERIFDQVAETIELGVAV